MSSNQIKNSADAILKLIDDSEKMPVSFFASKLSSASETYPEDYTIGAMANVVARMATNKLFITRAEVQDLYNHFYSRNNKFPELFGSEFATTLSKSTKYNREHDDESGNIINAAYDKLVDTALAKGLNAAFGNEVKTFSDATAATAKEVCENGFAGIIDATVDIVNGREDFIVCRAAFETPKGKVSVFVPIEIIAGKALSPNVFIGNSGPEDFTKNNVVNYITSNAGKKLSITASQVLSAVSSIKDANMAEVCNVDLVLTKLNAAKEAPADFSQGQVLFQKLEQENQNLEVKTPTYNDPAMQSIASQFETSNGIAAFKFGKNAVNTAKAAVSSRLSSLNINNAQISVFDVSDNSVVFAVSVNAGKTAFRVPVNMNGEYAPSVIISNGSIRDFSKKSIHELFTKEATDDKAAANASQFFGMKASDLIDVVRSAASNKNYVAAEEALNVLASLGNDTAYQTALSAYTDCINGVEKVISGCSMIVSNASSKHELCGHTGLPLHKVWQDKNNNCQPKYRQEMAETYEGATFMNSKIFF